MDNPEQTAESGATETSENLTFGQRLAKARKPASLRGTAKRFKISHTALGRLEQDDLTAVGPSKLTEIGQGLGVPLPEGHLESRRQRRIARIAAYCANPYCPGLSVTVTPDFDIYAEPRRFRISQKRVDDNEAFCDSCGKSLETHCLACETTFKQGAHCTRCALSFVPLKVETREYLIENEAQIREDQERRSARQEIEIDD
ncbi:MAG: hypothetical protein HN742_33380 [Lentisphaerae bacterium]|jgi:hypothetical protein|nr:hypothetical protein [Lentisphaerota bacterium]MBT5611307.1 hypothetical protein [Lentisphaerota bacterium]MBT7054788.1 hypothetical protein [Lentisphaerota bacterium]MBT7846811.1 hypothetical protein [Lentisphaerota bacterium]